MPRLPSETLAAMRQWLQERSDGELIWVGLIFSPLRGDTKEDRSKANRWMRLLKQERERRADEP